MFYARTSDLIAAACDLATTDTFGDDLPALLPDEAAYRLSTLPTEILFDDRDALFFGDDA